MPNDPHQFIEEMITSAKKRQDLSVWLKHPETSEVAKTVMKLSAIPHRKVELPNLAKIQGQVLDRIGHKSAPEKSTSSFPMFLKLGSAIFGSFMIVVSLTMGVAVAALQSVPGQTIYPLKKIVENIELRLTPNSKVPALQIQLADKRMSEIKSVLEQQESGQISEEEAQKIVSATVKDLQRTTAAAAKQPKATIVTKLDAISNELKTASIKTEGSVKIEIEKAIQSTEDSKAEAIKNAEEAGIEIEGTVVPPTDVATASGKVTSVSLESVSIGTTKFIITKNTEFVGLTAKELKIGVAVDIKGVIKDNKTYAARIALLTPPAEEKAPAVSGTETETSEPDSTEEPQ